MRVQTARKIAALGMLVLCAFAHTARADDVDSEARAAYDRGLAAHDHGDEETAAHEFARADELKPSNAALEAATASAIRASDTVFGMTLVERAKGRDLDASARATIERARTAFAGRVMMLVVDCEHARSCRVSVDGHEGQSAFDRIVLLPGAHEVVVARDESSQKIAISGQGGEVVRVVAASAPAPLPPPTPPERVDWKEPLAFGAIGVTAVLTGVTIASFADLRFTRSDFNRDNCGSDASPSTVPGSDCARLADAGRAAETRTNLLLVSSIFAGAATAAYVIVARPFASKNDVQVTASLVGTGAFVSIRTP